MLSRFAIVAATCAAAVFSALPASETLTDSINALSSGDKYRVIFVTTTLTKALSSDIASYNTIVQNDAAGGTVTAVLPGLSWTALASTASVNARANTGISSADVTGVNFFNTNGDLIATSGADLFDGSPLLPAFSIRLVTIKMVLRWQPHVAHLTTGAHGPAQTVSEPLLLSP